MNVIPSILEEKWTKQELFNPKFTSPIQLTGKWIKRGIKILAFKRYILTRSQTSNNIFQESSGEFQSALFQSALFICQNH